MNIAKPTIRSIAYRAGVATSTASQILRGTGNFSAPTVQRVLAAAEAVGYDRGDEQVRAPAAPGAGVAGVVAFNTMAVTLREPHAQDVIRGLHGGLAGAGMSLLLLPPLDTAGHVDAVRHMPIDLLFILSTFHRIRRSLDLAAERGIPVAYLENGGPDALPSMVRVDDVNAMRDLGLHLLELGHTRVAVVSMRLTPLARRGLIEPPSADSVENDIARVRLKGLEVAGLPVSHVFESSQATIEDGVEAARVLMRLTVPPTCIVCHSDTLAEGVIVGLREMGLKVPDDVSVTGYDGVVLHSLAPHRLTTVIQDGVLKGSLFAQAGRALLSGEKPRTAFLPQYFVRGTTTAAPRA